MWNDKIAMPTSGAKFINTINMSNPTIVSMQCNLSPTILKGNQMVLCSQSDRKCNFLILLQTEEMYIERRDSTLISNHSLSIRSSVKALARSSGVGRSKTQPFLRAPWAADCTVFRTPLLLANVTTCCLSDWRSLLPTPRPKSSASTFPVMAAWSCKWKEGRNEHIHCIQSVKLCLPVCICVLFYLARFTHNMNTLYWKFWPIPQLPTPPHTIRESIYLIATHWHWHIVVIANLKSQQIQCCYSNAFLLLWGRGPV